MSNFDEKHSYEPPSPSTTVATYDVEAGKPIASPGSRSWSWRFSSKSRVNSTIEEEDRQVAEADITDTSTRKLEECPNGYPRLSTFLASESNFSLYRGFSYLHSRILLELQDEISVLEVELDDLDEIDGATPAGQRRLKNRRLDARRPRPDDGCRPRSEVLAELRIKLVEYDELLIKARDLQAFQKPSERDYKSVRTWFWNLKPLGGGGGGLEGAFIKKKEDILTLRSGREWSGFDGMIESTLRRFDGPFIQWLFCTKELRAKTDSKHMYYYSASRVEAFVGLIITSIIFVLLVLPVVAMYKLTSFGGPNHGTFDAIGVLVVFTLLFSAAMSMLTKARRHELFAASAAYCAVLVVFISNFSGSSLGDSSGPSTPS